MVRLGNSKHNKFTADTQSTRGKRYAIRLAVKLHNKKLTGNYFIRTCNLEMVAKRSDIRIYSSPDNDEAFETEEQAREWFDTTVNVTRGTGVAVQLFSNDNQIVAESLLLNVNPDTRICTILIGDHLFQNIMASIRRCGKGFSYSKHGFKREIQLYDGEPREFHAGLPLRPILNMKLLGEQFGVDWLDVIRRDDPLYPFMKAAVAKGLNKEDAYTEAFAEFHVSQGREGEVDPGCHRPLANCAHCHKRENQTIRFKTCAACKLVFYCCKECQVSNWPRHKTLCKQNRNVTEISDVVD